MTPTPKHIEEAQRERSPETDMRCRQADISQLLNLLLLRHSAVMNTKDKNHPDELIIEQARDNALAELKWRFEGLRLGYNQLVTRYNKKENEAVDARGGNVTLRATLLVAQEKLVRMTDLVRYQRAELHEAGLINDDEYTRLCAIQDSPARLESYDQLRAERDEWKSQVSLLNDSSATAHSYLELLGQLSELLASLKAEGETNDAMKKAYDSMSRRWKLALTGYSERNEIIGRLQTHNAALLAVASRVSEWLKERDEKGYTLRDTFEVPVIQALSALEPLGIVP